MLRAWRALPALVILAGCSQPRTEPPAPTTTAPVAKASAGGEHGHKASQHGGIIVSIGADSYHAEAVFEKGGVLRLYMLGKDESKVLEIDAQPLAAFAKAEGDAEAEPVTLKPDPTADDARGKTSRFVAHLPKSLAGKKLDVTVPSVRIAGERFRLAFQSNPTKEDHDGMPVGVAAGDERKLYLTPGGKYTPDDIKANGNKTASEKFKGIKAVHDMRPKPGDPVCPITMTKANDKFAWVVGGQTYTFCCPPCVDEFVQTAKEKPDEIKEPDFYRKK
jgi:YHS domain-containing protein